MATLRYQLGDQNHSVTLKDATTIGRSDINDVCIPLISLSRQHAIISRIGNGYTIADLGSSNGIQINGQEVQNFVLADGMKFLLGNVEFSFHLEEDVPTRITTVPSPSMAVPPPLAPAASAVPVASRAGLPPFGPVVSAGLGTPVMSSVPAEPAQAAIQLAAEHAAVLDQLSQVIIGQRAVLNEILVALLAQGHVLLVGPPGLAKSRIVRSLGIVLGLGTKHIVLTPDLAPADLVGSDHFEEDPISGNRRSRFQQGPLFTNLLLAEDINRTAPKTQAALLLALQEGRVATAGSAGELPAPCLVIATQNPLQTDVPHPLSEAQLDQFMLALSITYPSLAEEQQILAETTRATEANLRPVLSGTAILQYQRHVRQMPVPEPVARYAAQLVRATRPNTPEAPEYINRWVRAGASPRAGQDLVLAAKARALLAGRCAVSCADLGQCVLPVLRHRLLCTPAAASESVGSEDMIRRLLETLPAPQE